jgi:hypothetical protein
MLTPTVCFETNLLEDTAKDKYTDEAKFKHNWLNSWLPLFIYITLHFLFCVYYFLIACSWAEN